MLGHEKTIERQGCEDPWDKIGIGKKAIQKTLTKIY